MKKSFKNLVQLAHKKYLEEINVNGGQLKSEFLDRLKFWSDKIHVDKIPVENLLNPYFIGYGNPDSEILIIGKELGFNVENDFHQVVRESFDHSFQWNEIIEGRNIDIEYLSSPLNPYGGIQSNFPGRHTWRLYREFLSYLNQFQIANSDFLNHAFLTEFNYAPSQYSPGNIVLDERRKEILSHEFFKSFSKVLLTYRAYDKHKKNQGLTEKLFDVKFQNTGTVGSQTYLKYSSQDNLRTVILTNQLSGPAGWSSENLKELAELFSV